ncbi:C40 family peptidase [Tenacibaculum maritimum]|uniref:NlpC/P60 family lipoprotein n=1 Tax=Tenacibaculum maritimum NCIMB 2154 TaxID=1349785 RepID=A0A2H1ECF9_9FLAO|nr:C40 family peptidase [Tenacibaculum maritimum]MCD9582134.1 C40 family peptidase [Tenacibaculum maritimum]MCD9636543.1 C40 family peptidase [Tenacibaculum maritimum]CAA0143167.1 NlpC/P60 family lipoprotein precursor [Tenacibaculum maritimum]CAA0168638.1 NlpC/P60 family lipoprotein precursor [Tenacibaculum maritimum]CAA0195802.1 NlpC/P60 family lipoprotein precursor [Tenacibaculum maritimum]
MIKKIQLLFILLLTITSCSSSRSIVQVKQKEASIADKIVWTAVSYKGVPYKYAGSNRKGMDCSGLIYTSFKSRNIDLPRTSRQMYEKGYLVRLKEVKRGDLLFFKTTNKRGKVNHVGLVTSIKNSEIRFIHSTSSKGVIVSSLKESYWKKAFVKAKRLL